MDMAAVNRRVIEQFRAGGPVEGMHRERLVLLTTTGAHSGQPHTAPMMFVPDDERLLVIASNAGATRIPDWYHNLVAHPEVHVELADEAFDARAVPVEGDERDRLWTSITERFPFFLDHEAKAGRAIPLVALTRR